MNGKILASEIVTTDVITFKPVPKRTGLKITVITDICVLTVYI